MPSPRPVRCIDTGVTYPSVKEAALAALGAPYGNIPRAIRKGTRCGGYRWEYVQPLPSDSSPKPRRWRRAIVASDGRAWPNLKAAASDTSYAPGSIYWAIYHQKPIGGLTWRFAA